MKRMLLFISFCAMSYSLNASKPAATPDSKKIEGDIEKIEILKPDLYGDMVHYHVPCSTPGLKNPTDTKKPAIDSVEKLFLSASAIKHKTWFCD